MFKTGQRVTCKDVRPTESGYPHYIELGGIYTIRSISYCPNPKCKREVLELMEIDVKPTNLLCACLENYFDKQVYYSYRFEPLIYKRNKKELIGEMIEEKTTLDS